MATLTVEIGDASWPTLGDQVIADIERLCVYGPGSLHDQPVRLEDEIRKFIRAFYRLYPKGHPKAGQRAHDRCVIELRKGTAKSELAAMIAFIELHPLSHCRFNGFDEHGNLLPGRPARAPYIPLLATGKDQAEILCFHVLKYIAEHSDTADMFGISLERITRLDPTDGTDAGMAEAVSNAPNMRDGARTTFQSFDEAHWLTLDRGKLAVEAMLQNAGKRQLETPWTLYTSTAGVPGLESVQEDVWREAQAIDEGRRDNSASLYYFSRWAGDGHNLKTVEGRLAALREAQGPIGEWGEGRLERIARDYDRENCDRAYWERVNLNRWRRSSSGAYDIQKAGELLRPDETLDDWAFVTVGFDGSRTKDSTAIVITEIDTGRQMLWDIWERPENAPEGWRIDSDEVSAAMEALFERFDVALAYCDPYWWTEDVKIWAGSKWGAGKVVEVYTGSGNVVMAAKMARAYGQAIDSESITFIGPTAPIMLRHVANAGRKDIKQTDEDGQPQFKLQKLDGLSQNKMDAAMAGNLSWQARLDAIAKNLQHKSKGGGIPWRVY